jgi:hypothetical protein
MYLTGLRKGSRRVLSLCHIRKKKERKEKKRKQEAKKKREEAKSAKKREKI